MGSLPSDRMSPGEGEPARPGWIDGDAYPFRSRWLDVGPGRLHYVDEGDGPALLLLHGNPTWSFLHRHLISGLSHRYRCVAPDHMGFGLSDKPEAWSYRPRDHAENLRRLIDALDLGEITLMVQDWGGPIGLSYALDRPGEIRAVIVINSWMWSVKGDPHFEIFSRFMGGPVGRFLIRRFNFFVNVLMGAMFRGRLPKAVLDHYRNALPTPGERKGCWVFPREVIGASDWLSDLWRRRDRIRRKPALILWGLGDIGFRKKELDRWWKVFPGAEVVPFPGAGHFLQEEVGPDLCPLVDRFLTRHAAHE